MKVMSYLIGKQLGAMIAHLESDLYEDFGDLETLQKLALASETFKNLSLGGMEGFQVDFDKGYASVRRDLIEMEQQRQAQFLRERSLDADTLEP
jgi:uncharacterized protein YaiL (DUF2058 family)